MDENWILMKEGIAETPTRSQWLQENLETGSVIGVDPFLCPISQWNELKTGLDKSGHRLVRFVTLLVTILVMYFISSLKFELFLQSTVLFT
jgi:Xaa-Pro aminopeptidase